MKYLGLPERKDIVWCADAEERTCDKLMEYVLGRGNFGHKISDVSNSGKIAEAGSIIGGFMRLQEGGLCRWEAARKHPILRPFAWLYQLCRVRGRIIRRCAILQLKNDLREAKDIAILLHSLGLE